MSRVVDEIINFMGTHECIESNRTCNKNINAKFTTFGNRAGIRALKDVIDILDEDTKERVLDMMKNKKVSDYLNEKSFRI